MWKVDARASSLQSMARDEISERLVQTHYELRVGDKLITNRVRVFTLVLLLVVSATLVGAQSGVAAAGPHAGHASICYRDSSLSISAEAFKTWAASFQGVSPNCYGGCPVVCVEWVDGHVDGGCYRICAIGCAAMNVSPPIRAACLAACNGACYVPGYCARYEYAEWCANSVVPNTCL